MSDIVSKQVFDDCKPLVKSGTTIKVAVSQKLTGPASEPLLSLKPNSPDAVQFSIEGPRIELDPNDVAGVYPAPDSRESPGEFVPHIALRRRTLPWERVGPIADAPWLALLLLNDKEVQSIASVQSMSIQHLVSLDVQLFKALGLSGGGVDTEAMVKVLTIQNSKLIHILPDKEELALLCHMKRTTRVKAVKDRHGTFSHSEVNEDAAIVICNRLPDPTVGGNRAPVLHFAFLVSLENRGDLYPLNQLDPNKLSRLIVLYQWKFTPSGAGDFRDVMQGIRYSPHGGVLRFGNLPQALAQGTTGPLHNRFAAALDDTGYFQEPLDHVQDGKVMYRGPLLPFPAPQRSKGFAVRADPDEFLEAPANAPRDYSYATAFELGRLMALSDSGLLEDLRSIHAVWKFPERNVVAVNKLPLALQKPDWVVDPPFAGANPWSVQANVSLLDQSELVAQAKGDFTGIAAVAEPWRNQVLNKATATPQGPIVQQVNMQTVTAEDLAKQFVATVNAARR
jgi:hypothetical protein